ncbi:hypothetical protein WJX81_008173 [Elliptochloris bilobata]|uniref:Uncharacterized protein n=1 Tax=Elliptochloris bilobata TaxID=381761 RepID=A0AAW1SJP4_9CHLO
MKCCFSRSGSSSPDFTPTKHQPAPFIATASADAALRLCVELVPHQRALGDCTALKSPQVLERAMRRAHGAIPWLTLPAYPKCPSKD